MTRIAIIGSCGMAAVLAHALAQHRSDIQLFAYEMNNRIDDDVVSTFNGIADSYNSFKLEPKSTKPSYLDLIKESKVLNKKHNINLKSFNTR